MQRSLTIIACLLMSRPLTQRFSVLAVIALALAGTLVGAPLHAQRVSLDSLRVNDTTVVHALILTDGTRLVGRITSLTQDSVRVVSATSSTILARTAVREAREFPASSMRNGELWPENPHATRLLFSPTAIPLRKGEGYFADFWIFIASAAWGVTDRFTMGAGMTLFPTTNLGDNVYYALPKYAVINRPTTTVAVGGLMARIPWTDGSKSVGILYGVATKGTRESNFTVGAGWGYVGDKLSNKPVVTIGGQHRASRRVAFITENWFAEADGDVGGFVTYGVRLLGEKMAVDLAFGNAVSSGDFFFPGVPLLGFAFKF